jgi:MFS transporter, SP family, solute carrier family 2 (myo-inositol transporter), member 13
MKLPLLIIPGAFGFYAGLCLLGWFFCLFCFPETAGLSLEEVQMIFRHGFGVEESDDVTKDIKKG